MALVAALLASSCSQAAPVFNTSTTRSPASRRLQSLYHADLTTWEQYGPSSAGDWAVRNDRIWLDQNINGHPTYYVAPFDVIETTVTGTFGVMANWDDDFLGFVFGFDPGNTAAAEPKKMVLFDWVRDTSLSYRSTAFRLLFIDRDGSPSYNSMSNYIPWSASNKQWIAVSPDSALQQSGWVYDELYDFKAFYGVNRIAIWMRCYAQQASCAHGAFGSDYKLVFDVANTASEAYMFADGFPNGRFGFYDFSQASTRYGRFLILCPLGHYCTAPDLSEYDKPTPCPAGSFGAMEGLTSELCSGSCSPGHHCPEASVDGASPDRLCDAGRYGSAGQVDSTCSGPCAAGYYCPAGSSSPQQNECGGNDVFCPEGSGSPVAVSAGHYSEGEGAMRRSRQEVCPVGHYCRSGVRATCPAGTFGAGEGLTTASCSGACREGYFCPAGSTTDTEQPCGIGAHPASYYCPAGTPTRIRVKSGEYSTPESAPESQRTGKAACPVGFACKDGAKNPSMFFGSSCPEGSTRRSVRELAGGARVGAPLELAVEEGVTATFSVDSVSPGPASLFALQQWQGNSTAQLLTGGDGLDFQTSPQYTVLIRAAASTGGDSVDCTIAVDVEDVNQQPVFQAVAERHVAEGSAVNEEVGAALASEVEDPDFGQALDFEITSGNGDGMFKINSCSGQIFVARRGLDINARARYTLGVRVSDDGAPPLSDSATVDVVVIDRPDPPVLQAATVEVEENQPVGTVVTVLNATDPDPGASLTFSLVRGSPVFGVRPATGELYVREARLDYELQQDYALRVQVADDSGLSDEADVTVRVLDGNDPPVLGAGAVRYVRENSPSGTAVGAPLPVTDEDRDAGAAQSVACEMVDGAGGVFAVNATNCQLVTTAAAHLDYETQAEYTVKVRARDSAGAVSAVREVTVRVVDVNDPPSLANRTFTLSESEDTGFVLGTLRAGDEDGRQVHTFVVETQYPLTSPPMWTVGAFDGVLRLAGLLDYEDHPLFTIRVRVRDNGHDPAPLAATATMTVHVRDALEPPSVAPPELFLLENATVGSVLPQRLTAEDPEGGIVTFASRSFDGLDTEDADASEVLAVAANGTLTLTAPLDYEDQAAYALLFVATDADGNSTQALARFTVGNVNEPPVLLPSAAVPPPRSELAGVVQPTAYNRTTVQASAVGRRIGAPIVAIDPEGDTVTYSLHAAPGEADGTELVAFASSTSGQIEVAAELDNVTDISLVLRATDPAGNAVEAAVRIAVDDSNFPPKFGIDKGTLDVAENSAPGTSVGNPLPCSDDDPGDTVRISIVAGNTGGLFAVDAETGQLSVAKDGLNHESERQYVLSLSCDDDGEPQLSDMVTVTVNVLDVNEPPVIGYRLLSVPEHVPVGYLVGNITFSDPDADDQGRLTLSLRGAGGGSNPFRASPTSSLTATSRVEVADAVLDFESGTTQYALEATVGDGELSDSARIEVRVLNVNEPPMLTADSGGSETEFRFTALENVTLGTVVGRLTATDPDAETTLTFSRVSGGAGVLEVQADGRVTVAGAGLDWERQVEHQLTVCVEDNGIPFNRKSRLSEQGTATVTVVNVNDATVAALSGALRSNTSGEGEVRLHGTDLGVAAPRGSSTAVRAFYREPGNERRGWYEARDCNVTTQNTEVECHTVPGVGFGMEWRIEVGDGEGRTTVAPPAVASTGYLPPSLQGVDGAAGLSSAGGQPVRLRGENLGPMGAPVMATATAVSVVGASAPAFTTRACEVTAAHREVTCDSPAGFGAELEWEVSVGGQGSNSVPSGGYAPPVVDSVNASGLLSTRGGETVVLLGSGFGAAAHQLRVTYGPTGREYEADFDPRAGLVQPHSEVRCVTVPGVGRDLAWRVVVGGQESNATASPAAYTPPRLDSVQVVGADELVTSGGQTVLLRGDHFGPPTPRPGGRGAPTVTYGPTGTEFEANACAVTESGAQIACASAPGTGRDLVWAVRLGSQASNALATSVRYASPVVLQYEGPGANDGGTAGGERVVIRGRQFGTAARSAITRVTYRVAADGGDGSLVSLLSAGEGGAAIQSTPAPSPTRYPARDPVDVVYEARNCRVTVDHVELVCETAPGAGRNLRWSVVVDGQPSRDASTQYGPPTVARLSGPGAVGASTEGGERVVVHGSNFGPPGNASFLDRVTYGPSGYEYVARDCVVVSYEEVNCTTAPGIGSGHRWSVEVGGQLSGASAVTTSFAAPAILALAPARAPAAGGVALVLNATNLGLHDLQADQRVLLAGREIEVVETRMLTPTVGQVTTLLPAGAGAVLDVIVETVRRDSGTTSGAGQRSQPVHFSYEAPVIEMVTTAEVVRSPDLVEVIVRGRNFGPSPGTDGRVRIGPRVNPTPTSAVDVTSHATAWSDSTVRVAFDGTEGTVEVVAGGQVSNAAKFRNINPSLSVGESPPRIVAGAGSEVGALPLTQGGATLEIVGKYFSSQLSVTLGGQVCPVTGMALARENSGTSRVNCTIPPGQGARAQLVVLRDGSQPSEPRFTLAYQRPSVTEVVPATQLQGSAGEVMQVVMPTEGGPVTLRGRNFGLTPRVTVVRWPTGAVTLTPSQASHRELEVDVPAGEGAGLMVLVVAGDQTNAGSLELSYEPPTLERVSPDHGPTVGNTTLAVSGRNFGVAGPTVRVGDTPCDLLPGHSHTEALCLLRPGEGRNLPVSVEVGAQNSSVAGSPVRFAFDPPVVLSVSPRQGRTEGGENVTVRGRNFGLRPSVAVVDAASGGGAVVAPVQWWRHDTLVISLPPGQGAGKAAVVTAGQQESSAGDKGAAFAYAPPRVNSVSPSHGPTDGDYDLVIQGDNFGSEGDAVSVAVGPYACAVQLPVSHRRLACRMPAGMGAGLAVAVAVSGQTSGGGVSFSFDPPTVTALVPNVPDAEGERVDVRGRNFGVEGTDAKVWVSGKPCAAATWVRDATYNYEAYIRCQTPRDVAGWKNVTLSVAKQTARVDADERVFKTQCKRGWYGRDGEQCLPCTQGATCAGEGAEPVSDAGWFNTPLVTPDDRCPSERQARPACPFIVPCEPKEACTGNDSCATGYAGVRCASCAPDHYRRAGLCEVCPDNPFLLLLGFAVGCVLLCAAGWTLHRKQVSVAFFSIGVDYFQVLALFGTARVAWPPELLRLYHALSIFNLNLELTAPECSLDVTFERKWWFTMALPLGAMVVFLSMYAVKYLQKRCVQRRRQRLHSHLPALIGVALTMCYYLYLYVVRTTLDIFNCSPTTPPDGNEYMEAVFVKCYEPGGLHMRLLPFAVLFVLLYGVGYPLLLAWLLWRHRMTIREDQVLRARGTGDTRLTNPDAYNLRKRLHKTYYHFKPTYHWWTLAILGRKFLIAFAALMFRKNVSFQLAVVLLVLFVSYTLQVKYRPYMSVSEHDAVWRDLRARAEAAPAGWEAQVVRRTEAVEKKVSRPHRGGRMLWNVDDLQRPTTRAVQASEFVTNYNTVEGVLLFCAVLVCLSGIMFESGRFEGDYFEVQRRLITWVVIIVVITSILYFTVMLALEVGTFLAPECIRSARSRLAGRRSHPDSDSDGDDEGATDTDAGAVELAAKHSSTNALGFNPMFMQDASESDRAIAQATVTATSWDLARYKAEYESLANKVEQLQSSNQRLVGELRSAKKGVVLAGAAVRMGGAHTLRSTCRAKPIAAAQRKKKVFAPVDRPAAEGEGSRGGVAAAPQGVPTQGARAGADELPAQSTETEAVQGDEQQSAGAASCAGVAASASASARVVGEWRAVRDPEGKVYYYNSQTRTTTWTRPSAMDTQ